MSICEDTAQDTALVVCQGSRRLKGGGLGMKFQMVNEFDSLIGEPGLFAIKNRAMRAMRPGAMYRVKAALKDGELSTIVSSTASYVKMFRDTEAIAEWQALSSAEAAADRQDKAHKKAAYGNLQLRELLRPIVKAMAETNHYGRLAIQVEVLYELQHYARYYE